MLYKSYERILNDRDYLSINTKATEYAAEDAYHEIMAHIHLPEENLDTFVEKNGSNLNHKKECIYTYKCSKSLTPHIVIVIPTRNDETKIKFMAKALLDEIKKSVFDIYLVFVVNNSSDNTTNILNDYLKTVKIENLHTDIVDIYAPKVTSLSSALNHGYTRFISEYNINPEKDGYFFATYDGDSIILNAKEKSIIDQHLEEFKKDKNLMSISGQSVDIRRNITHFHNFSNLSCRPEVVINLMPKPYTHGGGGGLYFKLSLYPKDLLKQHDLGGLSINILSHINKDPNVLKDIPFYKWITRTNNNILSYHPTRTNIYDWICTYLGYRVFRDQAKEILSPKILNIWEAKRSESKKFQMKILYSLAEKFFSLRELAGYLIIKRYFYDDYILNTTLDRKDFLDLSPKAHTNI